MKQYMEKYKNIMDLMISIADFLNQENCRENRMESSLSMSSLKIYVPVNSIK